jgi:hypothetical protein
LASGAEEGVEVSLASRIRTLIGKNYLSNA